MKKQLLQLSLILLLSITTMYSQENKNSDSSSINIEKYIFDYALSYFDDFRAVIFLYRTELKKEPKNLDDITEFIKHYNLNYEENPNDIIEYISNDDGSSRMIFSLVSAENYEHTLFDSIIVKRANGIINMGAPMLQGGSMTTIDGEIISGEVKFISGKTIHLQPYKANLYVTRVDIETYRRVGNLK